MLYNIHLDELLPLTTSSCSSQRQQEVRHPCMTAKFKQSKMNKNFSCQVLPLACVAPINPLLFTLSAFNVACVTVNICLCGGKENLP